MATGRSEIKLFLDADGSVRAARRIDEAIASIGDRARLIAAQFDGTFDRAFDRVKASAAAAGRYIRSQFEDLGEALNLGSILNTSIGTFAGNLISAGFRGLLDLLSRLLDTGKTFFETAIAEARELANSQLFLRSAVEETGASYETLTAKAKTFALEFATTRADAFGLEGKAALAVQGLDVDGDVFLRRLTDLAAARGRGVDEIPELLGQLFTSDEATDKLFGGKNPSQIWEEYAKSIGKSAAALTNLEQRQAIVNLVIQKGAEFAGAASGRLQTFGGLLEQISALGQDVAASVGERIGQNVGLNAFLQATRDGLLALLTDQSKLNGLIDRFAQLFVNVAEVAVPILATLAKGAVYFIIGMQTIVPATKRIFEQMLADVDYFVSNVKLIALRAGAEIAETIAEALAKEFPLIGSTIAEKGKAVAASLIAFADQTEREFAARQAATKQAVFDLGAEIGKQTKPFDGVIAGIDDLAKRALAALPKFAQFADPTKGVDALGSAAAAAAKEFRTLKQSIDEATAAAVKTADQQLESLSRLSDLRAQRERFGAGPRIAGTTDANGIFTPQFKVGLNGQRTDEFLFAPAKEESDVEKLQRLARDVRDQFRVEAPVAPELQEVGDTLRSISADLGKGLGITGIGSNTLIAEGTTSQLQPEIQERLDKFLLDRFSKFTPDQIRAAGLGGDFEERLRRAEERESERLKKTQQEQVELNKLIKDNQTKLAALFAKVSEAKIDVPGLLEAVRKLAKDGLDVTVENKFKVQSDRQFSINESDGSASDRIAGRGSGGASF